MALDLNRLTAGLSRHMPAVVRWAGAVAMRLRSHNITIEGKKLSGNANTDALTLGDLTVQELLVAALRDADPIFRHCRIEAEEDTGDLDRFAQDSEYTIALDPIDGTKAYRDRTQNVYSIMLTLRSVETLHYSLVYSPELGPHGTWVEAIGQQVVVGPDDHSRAPLEVLWNLPAVDPVQRPDSNKMYVIGFQKRDAERAASLSQIGLHGHTSDMMPASIYEALATGDFGGSLIHSPNVYDFPASLHIARLLGGDAWWVHNRQPVRFEHLWMDERAGMLRLPGIVACATNRETLNKLCDFAKDWDQRRYVD